MTPKIIAIASSGAGAGKTTLAEYLITHPLLKGWQFASTSDVLVNDLVDQLGVSTDYIIDNKEKYRPELIRLGNHAPLYALTKAIAKCDKGKPIIFESVRRNDEYDTLKDLGAVFLLVCASERTRRERRKELPKVDINEVCQHLIDDKNTFLVNNDRTLQDLKDRADEVLNIIMG